MFVSSFMQCTITFKVKLERVQVLLFHQSLCMLQSMEQQTLHVLLSQKELNGRSMDNLLMLVISLRNRGFNDDAVPLTLLNTTQNLRTRTMSAFGSADNNGSNITCVAFFLSPSLMITSESVGFLVIESGTLPVCNQSNQVSNISKIVSDVVDQFVVTIIMVVMVEMVVLAEMVYQDLLELLGEMDEMELVDRKETREREERQG